MRRLLSAVRLPHSAAAGARRHSDCPGWLQSVWRYRVGPRATLAAGTTASSAICLATWRISTCLTIDDGPVPTVSNLNRVRRPLADTFGVGAGTVACDNLDTGMLAKPRGQRFCLSVGQQVHNVIALQIEPKWFRSDGRDARPSHRRQLPAVSPQGCHRRRAKRPCAGAYQR
jgi:hypothetical protein